MTSLSRCPLSSPVFLDSCAGGSCDDCVSSFTVSGSGSGVDCCGSGSGEDCCGSGEDWLWFR